MKFMVLLVTLAAVAALPRKSTKDFPKKYNAALDGEKHTYAIYSYAPNEDIDVPAPSPFIDDLVAPSSYDAYFDQDPRDPILPPEGSTYIGVSEMSEGDELIPPPLDTYSSHASAGLSDLAPPPVSAETSASQTSYITYEDSPQDPLEVPELSSYAQIPADKSGSDVLEYLVAMIKAMPQTSSYAEIIPEDDHIDGEDTTLLLSPPQVEDLALLHSSYGDVITQETDLTAESVPAEETDLTAESVPAEETDLTAESVPAEETDLTAESVPAEETDLTAESVPAEETDLTAESVPAEETDLTAESVPAEETDLTAESVPAEETDLTAESVPAEETVPVPSVSFLPPGQ